MTPEELADYIRETADRCRVCGRLPNARTDPGHRQITVACCYSGSWAGSLFLAVVSWNKHQRDEE